MALLILPVLQLLFLRSSVSVRAQPRQNNVTLGSSLAASDGSSWPSPSGHFAFGFYPKSEGLAIGVWLATTPERTIVWTANRDDPPITGGYVRLTFDGRLLWGAPGGMEEAISDGSEPAAFAAMIDTGKFALYNSQGVIIWSTFDAPTDTLLSGQSLLPNTQLVSSLSETDRSTGMFRLNNQNDANLVLYPAGSTNTADDAYWDTGTFQIGFLLTLNLDSSGSLYLSSNSGNYTKNITQPEPSGSEPGAQVFYRAIVDVDGIFRLYSHSFSNNGNWTTRVEWAAPDNKCLVRGICPLNSYCSLGADMEPNCLCPPGFDFIDPSKISLGCAVNSSAGECTAAGSAVDDQGLSMATMTNTTWVNKAYFIFQSSTSMDDCKAACLTDCFCKAALFTGGTCSKQMLPLRYGRTGSNDTLFVKVGAVKNQGAKYQEKKSKSHVYVFAISLALAAFSVIAIATSGFLFLRSRRFGRYTRTSELDNSGFDEENTLRAYSYEELERATENFREELGRGAFGTVFKGSFSGGERLIAVKRLEKMVEEGEREFQREVRAIGKTHHRNLVRLFGFCNEGSNRLLVYEYMSGGSLADLLFRSKSPPSLGDRCRIAVDVARGLQYLHEELESNIIHCDIKPQNILMDASGTARIADFGLAKLLMPDQTRTYTGIRGTRGYLAPEWHRNAPVTVKADVYSYGVVLLEIICCKRNIGLEEEGLDCTLAQVVYECWEGDELHRLKREEVVDDSELERLVKVGLWCVQNEPVLRPSMRNVVMMLEGHVQVPLPPPPSSFSF